MNSLMGTISDIDTSGSLSLVSVEIQPHLLLKTIVIETPETAMYLQLGGCVKVLFKATEVVIGTQTAHEISLQNRILCTILEIESGNLISQLKLSSEAGELTSIISTNAVQQLNLKSSMPVYAMIKLNEIMLSAC